MTKKTIITISLVPETSKESNEVIKDQIRKESSIPFCAEIEKVEIEESGNCAITNLQRHGLSKNVATNVVRFYRSDSDKVTKSF